MTRPADDRLPTYTDGWERGRAYEAEQAAQGRGGAAANAYRAAANELRNANRGRDTLAHIGASLEAKLIAQWLDQLANQAQDQP